MLARTLSATIRHLIKLNEIRLGNLLLKVVGTLSGQHGSHHKGPGVIQPWMWIVTWVTQTSWHQIVQGLYIHTENSKACVWVYVLTRDLLPRGMANYANVMWSINNQLYDVAYCNIILYVLQTALVRKLQLITFVFVSNIDIKKLTYRPPLAKSYTHMKSACMFLPSDTMER